MSASPRRAGQSAGRRDSGSLAQSGCLALERVKISAMIVSHGRYVTFQMALTAAGERLGCQFLRTKLSVLTVHLEAIRADALALGHCVFRFSFFSQKENKERLNNDPRATGWDPIFLAQERASALSDRTWQRSRGGSP